MKNAHNKIQILNDKFRGTLTGGDVMLSRHISLLPPTELSKIIKEVRTYNHFSPANDPYKEHDFGNFDYNGKQIFWKIDYYDTEYLFLSRDPTNPQITRRVLTIMFADEY